MTTDRIALRELLEKGSEIDLLREMIGFVVDRLMAPEVEGRAGGHPEAMQIGLEEALAGPRHPSQRIVY